MKELNWKNVSMIPSEDNNDNKELQSRILLAGIYIFAVLKFSFAALQGAGACYSLAQCD
jgi:hypothetical protein